MENTIYNIVNQCKDCLTCFDAYIFVIILLLIIVVAIIIIYFRLQRSNDDHDKNMLERDKISMEAEIIKNLRELARADADKRKDKDEPGRKFTYNNGSMEYALRSEEIETDSEKFIGTFKFTIKIVDCENVPSEPSESATPETKKDVRTQLIEGLKSSKAISESKNLVRDFLYLKAKQHLLTGPEIELHLVDFSENYGSYVIEFTLITIALISQYASVRSGLEYFINDSKTSLEKIFGNDIKKVEITKSEMIEWNSKKDE